MKRFKNFLIEKEDLGQTTQYGGKAPSGALRRRVVDPAVDFAKEVGSALKDNPVEFGKQYAQSLLTDPETYHSGLAAAGMIPGVGEIADMADAAIYAGQGDTEGTKMALASMVPFTGMIPGMARLGKSAKALKEPLNRAEQAVKDAKATWRETKAAEHADTMNDPFFSQRFLKSDIPATDDYITLANKFGFEIPRVDQPTASLTGMEVLQGVYGKDARKNVELAKRAQERATRRSGLGVFDTKGSALKGLFDQMGIKYAQFPEIRPTRSTRIELENPSEFPLPDYSDSALAKKFNVYVGTHRPEGIEGTVSPISPYGYAEVHLSNPNSLSFNVTNPKNLDFGETMTHELTHDLGFANPKTAWPAVRASSTSGNYADAWNALVKDRVPRRYTEILDDPNFTSKLQPHPNNALIRDYFSNTELPGQVAQAKAWMQGKGLPNVNANMSQEEATRIRDMVLDKYGKGMFPEFKGGAGGRAVPAIIDIIGSPQGKKLFELIAKRNTGSEVNNRVNQIGYA
jgi:hypothetical protein